MDKKNKKENKQLIRFDWAMKRLLRDQANFDVLEGFLSAVLDEDIKIKAIIESESNRKVENEKFNRVDIKCLNSKGEVIIIEVQNTSEADYLQRLLFGIAQAVTEHIDKGHPYKEIPKIYSISIVYFPLGKGDDYVYKGVYDFRGLHTHQPLEFTQSDKSLLGIDKPSDPLPVTYFLMVADFDKVAVTPLDQWIAYLKDGTVDPTTTVPGLKEAREKLDIMKMPRQAQNDYYRYLSDAASFVLTQETKDRIAKEEGYTEGFSDGEAKEKIKTIKRMKANGFNAQIISAITELPISEIEKLLSELQ